MKQKLFRLMLAVLAVLLVGNIHLHAKKVHTLGDSTMAPYNEETTGTRGWGMYFGNFLTNGWTSVNYAKGGRDSRGGYNELWQNAKNSVEAGDYVIIQFAHNDTKYNGVDNLELQAYYTAKGDATNAAAVKSDGRGTTPSTTYKECLQQIVDAVKEKGATPILVSAVCRCNLTNGVVGRNARHDLGGKYDAIVNGELKTGLSLPEDDHTMDYTYHMKQLATQLNVQFIDMTAATKKLYESYETQDKLYAALFDKGPKTTADNTHYNLTGALMAARLCAQLLKEAGILADAVEIPTDLSITPAAADMGDVYVGQSATKELTLSGLGLDPATGSVSVTASEGIQLSVDKQNWQSSLTVNYESGTVIKTFYAKVAATAVGVFNGTITATLGEKSAVSNVTMNAIELGGGDPFTATWALTSNDNAVVDGNATAAAAKIAGMVKYGNNSTNGLLVSTSEGGAWVKAEDDSPNQYVEFTVTCPEGKKLDISSISMKIGGKGGGGVHCHAYYSTDGFVTRTTFYAPASMSNGVMNEVAASPVVQLEEGDQFQIRVYPWYTSNATGKWLCIQDVVISGQSKDAAGVNIPGTITYALDKGGLLQNDDDAVMDPTELSAGFAAKKWSYDGTNEKVVIEGTTFNGATGDTKMMQLRYDAATSETLSTVANDDCTVTLTLTPEDGFSFVPSKVSFLAGKFNSGNPHLTFAVEAGDTKQTLKDNVELNRSKTTPRVDPSAFSEELSGFTATADNPLKLHFSFLNVQGTRSAGIANLVIEGTLVGAAAQVTKYALNTIVEPAEAGSITRTPDMETYKEGSQVTLKANKNFGYKFKEWQDANGVQVSTDAETVVTMDAEKTMKAVFETVPVYTVKTDVTNDADRTLGSVTLTPNDHDGKYEAGTKIIATANESRILKFLSWTDEYENNGASATREVTVNGDMKLVANYEVQDFIAVFDASTTSAYASQGSYPFAADVTWDAQRNAKVSVVKQSDGSLVKGTNSTPVVRNRQASGVLTTLSGVFQNGYNTAEVAWQYQFSTVGFTTATFVADMAAKNAATKNWKAQVSTDGVTFADLGDAWQLTANTLTPLSLALPTETMGKETVYVRIMGTGTELLSTSYAFDAGTSEEGLNYTTHSESQVGNVFVLGDAEVVADKTAPVVTATIPTHGATDVSATGKITVSFDEKIESANSNGAVTLNDMVLTPTWSNRSVSFDYSALDYNTEYTFQMPAGYVKDRFGNVSTKAVKIVFTTMQRPTVTKALYDFVVPTDGTIDEALAAANNRTDKNSRYRVFIMNSTEPYVFHPQGTVTGGDGNTYDNPTSVLTAANTSFIGESVEGVVLTNVTPPATWDNGFGPACPLEGIGKGDVLQIKGQNSYFQNLTIKTSMGDAHGRDIAVNDQSNRTIFKDACLWGYQDTYVSNNQNGKFYFEGGIIRGRTDYICGKGDVYYNKVTFRQVKDGYLAVPSVPKKYGYILQSCKITGDADGVDGKYTLGRPWGKGTPIALFIDTEMEVAPSAIGWSEMSGGYAKRMAEYGSHRPNGSAVNTEGRKTFFDAYDKDDNGNIIESTRRNEPNNPILTAEEAAVPTLDVVMGQDDGWQPTLATEQAPVPENVVANNATLTWDDSNYTLLWAICKDDVVVAFTKTPTYTVKEKGTYSVRAANEMGGLSAASEAVVVSTTTGIRNINEQDNAIAVTGIYTVDGKRLDKMQRGLNIVRMSDGTTRKIVVR